MLGELRIIWLEQRPESGLLLENWQGGLERQYADDGVCQTVERDCVADQRRTPSESLFPQAVTQHNDRSAIEITGNNGATVRRADAEQREEVWTDDVAANQL